MTTFQLDECLNDKSFKEECEAEEKAQVWRFPRALKGEDDSVVLSTLLQHPRPLLTKDRAIADKHISSIPTSHPGIIVFANAPDVPQTITVPLVKKLLTKFKACFPDWHQAPLKNSIVELTQVGIEVRRVEQGQLVSHPYLSFDSAGWQEQLIRILRQNAGLLLTGGGDDQAGNTAESLPN